MHLRHRLPRRDSWTECPCEPSPSSLPWFLLHRFHHRNSRCAVVIFAGLLHIWLFLSTFVWSWKSVRHVRNVCKAFNQHAHHFSIFAVFFIHIFILWFSDLLFQTLLLFVSTYSSRHTFICPSFVGTHTLLYITWQVHIIPRNGIDNFRVVQLTLSHSTRLPDRFSLGTRRHPSASLCVKDIHEFMYKCFCTHEGA